MLLYSHQTSFSFRVIDHEQCSQYSFKLKEASYKSISMVRTYICRKMIYMCVHL